MTTPGPSRRAQRQLAREARNKSVECPVCDAEPGDDCVPLSCDWHLSFFDGEGVHGERHVARKGYRLVKVKVPA